MITRLYRPVAMCVAPLALIACMNSTPTIAEQAAAAVPLGIDLGASGPVTASPEPRAPAAHRQHAGEMPMAHGADNDAHGTGTVNSVDSGQHKVNMSHAPIPEIGWPAMTIEFPVASSVDLKAIKPGMSVKFTIEQQPGGMYEIKSIAPSGGVR
jgi:Cu/Ag efflux protein CusF